MPTSTRSTRRSSSGTTHRCAAGRSSWAAGWCWRPATRPTAIGVRTAMGGAQARRLCPHAVVVKPRLQAYTDASRAMFEVFEDTTPLVEGLSIDEAFLDVRGLRGSPARRWRSPWRCGARSASGSGCRSPSGSRAPSSWPRSPAGWPSPTACWSVPPDGELAFLHPLPVERLWGVGPVTAAKLRGSGITTVGEVARLGGGGAGLDRSAARRAATSTRSRTTAIRGRCSVVAAGARWVRSERSAGAGARRRSSTPSSSGLVDRLTRRLRAAHRVCRTVILRLRFDDFSRATRSHTLAEATAQTRDHPRRGPGPARGSDADDRAPGPDAARDHAHATSATTRPSNSRCRSTAAARPTSTRRWTVSATASGPRRSRAPSCWAATRAWRCRCCPIEYNWAPCGSSCPHAAAPGICCRWRRSPEPACGPATR